MHAYISVLSIGPKVVNCWQLIPKRKRDRLDWETFQALIQGESTIDVPSWRACTSYTDFSANSKEVDRACANTAADELRYRWCGFGNTWRNAQPQELASKQRRVS